MNPFGKAGEEFESTLSWGQWRRGCCSRASIPPRSGCAGYVLRTRPLSARGCPQRGALRPASPRPRAPRPCLPGTRDQGVFIPLAPCLPRSGFVSLQSSGRWPFLRVSSLHLAITAASLSLSGLGEVAASSCSCPWLSHCPL